MNRFTKELVYQKASANLSEEAAYALAKGMGLVDEKTAYLLEKLPGLREEWDLNKNGMIDAGLEAAGYNQALINLYNNLERLDGKTARTTVITSFLEEGTPYGERSNSSRVGGEIGGQHGLSYIVPPGYNMDTAGVRASSGEQVTITPRQGNTYNQTWNVYTNGGQQPYQRDYNMRRALAQ